MSQHNPALLTEGGVFHGRYRIVRCIKAGGMGAVYECVHLATRKHRALKLMLPEMIASPGMRDRFELEARVTAEIESDHIVETFDAGVDKATGAPFLVMELLRGDDLESILQRRGRFTAKETVALLSQAALALDRTHAAGIIHRDLKPENLFLTRRDDASPRLKILDFGIAKVVADGSGTAEQTAVIGTPVYMSPEQTMGDGTIGPPADLYALAHIAYALLAGHAYWMEEQQSLSVHAFVSRMLAGAGEPPSARAARRGVTLPSAFDAWFARATARAPGQRFDRASAQIVELAAVLGTAVPRILRGTPRPLRPQPSHPRATPHQRARGGVAASSPPPPPRSLGASASAGSGTAGASVRTIEMRSNDRASAAPAKRSAAPLAAGAILLLVAGLAVLEGVVLLGRESAPAVMGSPPAETADVRTAPAPAAPIVLPAETAEVGTAAPSASAPPNVR